MRVIILAAGQGFLLDGMVKCLVRAPDDGSPLLERAVRAFAGHKITVVVGYRAVAVMEAFPNLEYVYNPDWATTNNSYSLGIALTDEPAYVLSSDLVFDPALITDMDRAGGNIVLTELRENRVLTSINCAQENGCVRELYVGPLRLASDPEAIGIFKVSDRRLLQQWKRNCLKHGNLFVGQNLPIAASGVEVCSFDLGQRAFYEINTPADYLRVLQAHQRSGANA